MMDELIKQTKLLLHEIQNSMGHLESATDQNADSIESHINGRISCALDNCDRLEIIGKKEPPNRREQVKLQVDSLKYDCRHLQTAFHTIQHRRRQRFQEEAEREQLMRRAFQPNNADTSIMIDHALNHQDRLSNSHNEIDNILGSGRATLNQLREQHNTLKSAQKKLFDLMNTLGLSNTVMRLIERRTSQDKLILYGGMLVTCIIIFLTIRYFT